MHEPVLRRVCVRVMQLMCVCNLCELSVCAICWLVARGGGNCTRRAVIIVPIMCANDNVRGTQRRAERGKSTISQVTRFVEHEQQ